MPSIEIVTVSCVGLESVAVKVKSEPPSATVLALVARVTVGVGSLSGLIAIVSACEPDSVALPPVTLVTAMTAVSAVAVSYIVSLVGVKDAVPVRAPAAIVISGIVVKSAPSVAVPVGVKPTVTVSNVALLKVAVKIIEAPAFSAITAALFVKANVGAVSSSTIATVTDLVSPIQNPWPLLPILNIAISLLTAS